MVNRSKQAVSLLISLMLLATPAVAWSQRQDIFDWWQLRNYQASAEIKDLAQRTTMTDSARHLLYVYHAELEDKLSFNRNCPTTEQTIVLGCYVSGQGIYIFKVTDQRLAGIEEVTVAHEMLHAAYERLSGSERKRIDTLTQQAFDNLTDQRIKGNIKAYRDRDPKVVPTELHSIIGTEVRNLSPELEAYYQRYFKDRKTVVSFSEHYEAAFSERRAQVARYDEQLKQLREQIDSNQMEINNRREELNRQKAALDAALAAKRYEEYNAGVPPYNAAVRSFNALVNRTQSLIDEFNTIVAARNAIALEESELSKAMDSRPSTIQTQ
jgi:hypothetical protein